MPRVTDEHEVIKISEGISIKRMMANFFFFICGPPLQHEYFCTVSTGRWFFRVNRIF